LLCRLAPTAQCPTISAIVCFPDSDRQSCADETIDFGNATLAGLPTNLLNRLQSVLNAAAQSIAGLRRSDHVTDRHSCQFSLASCS